MLNLSLGDFAPPLEFRISPKTVGIFSVRNTSPNMDRSICVDICNGVKKKEPVTPHAPNGGNPRKKFSLRYRPLRFGPPCIMYFRKTQRAPRATVANVRISLSRIPFYGVVSTSFFSVC